MNEFTDLPPDRTFGTGFSYAAWPKNTTVSLHNVPWSSDYRDVVKFTNQSALDTYLRKPANAGPVINGMSRATNVNVPIRIALPFHQVYQYNYLRVHNDAQPIAGDGANVYYYFIQDVRYIAGNNTELIIQLDVWQTFNHHVTFGNCYIERGHIGIANTKQMEKNGRTYLTVPEGLDLGAEYEIRDTSRETLGKATSYEHQNYDIIMATSVSMTASGGDTDNPYVNTAQGSTFEKLPNGMDFYHFESLTQFQDFMRKISSRPWMSQGIVSIMAVPNIPAADIEVDVMDLQPGVGGTIRRLKSGRVKPRKLTLSRNFRDRGLLPARYAHLKKFYTHPYTTIEITTYSGTPLLLKPESMRGEHVEAMLLMHVVLPNPRVVVYPYKYNYAELGDPADEFAPDGSIYYDNGEFLDMATGIYDMPTFSTVNSSYTSFLASNAKTLTYQQQSADWSQQRALTGNQLSFDQSSTGMAVQANMTQQANAASGRSLDANLTALQQRTMLSSGTALVGGAAGGTPGSVVSGAMSSVTGALGSSIDYTNMSAQQAIGANLATSQTAMSQVGQAYNRDTNKEYADFAARGDYQNTIAAISARVQDARMLQPSVSGQLGGDAFNLAMYEWAVHSKVKMLQGAAMAAIGEYWLRYGYQVNRFGVLPAELHVMEKFTYWKLRETYIRSTRIPEGFRMAIRGIFEKGVTVWRNPDDIGVIDIGDNAPLRGIEL